MQRPCIEVSPENFTLENQLFSYGLQCAHTRNTPNETVSLIFCTLQYLLFRIFGFSFSLLCTVEQYSTERYNDEGEGSLNVFNIFDLLHAYGLVMVQMDFEHGLNKSPPPPAV